MSADVGAARATGPRIGICFHGIGEPRRELEPGEAPYWVGVDLFHAVLDTVAGDPRVELSFDDGNESDVSLALPALRARGLGATFFVLAGRLDRPGSLGSAQVEALAADPAMRVGTHGMDHVPWRGLDDDAARRELVEARDRIAAVTGTTPREAALPLGRYDRRLLGRLRDLGYDRVHCSDRRWGRDDWLVPRFSVRDGDSVASLQRDVLSPASRRRRLTLAAKARVKAWR